MFSTDIQQTRPAVLAISGLAAGAALYGLYRTFLHQQTATALHRSNAVHRTRNARSRAPRKAKIDIEQPDYGCPFGTMIISAGSTSTMFPIGIEPAPTQDFINRTFGPELENPYMEILSVATSTILEVASCPESQQHVDQIIAAGFGPLFDALERESVHDVLRCRERITEALGSSRNIHIDGAVASFMTNHGYTLPGGTRFGEGGEELLAISESEHGGPDRPNEGTRASDGLRGLLYYIAENDAKRKAYEHRGIRCESCSEEPIRGVRYHCLNCPDYDLCATCEANEEHIRTHVMAKVKIPLPVLSQPALPIPTWYPGNPDKESCGIEHAVRKSMAEEYEVDETFVDALLDQFKCVADTALPDDSSKINVGISFRAFRKALTPDRWSGRFKPNALIDRMFQFYDTNTDGVIDFREFFDGWAFLRGPRRKNTFVRALKPYDTNHDGFLDRSDFMRMHRARFELNKQLVRDMVKSREDEHTRSAMNILHSSAPISSIFNQEEIPRGDTQPRLNGKRVDEYGEVQAMSSPILPDDTPFSEELPASGGGRERLAHHLSRSEETSNSPEQPSTDQPDHGVHSDTSQGAYNQDTLCAVVEGGLQQLLHGLFLAKENEYKEIVATREDRKKWKHEIEAMLEAKKRALQELKSSDPEISAALSSDDIRVEEKEASASIAQGITAASVPTDARTLEAREISIASRSLEELLSAAGYSTIDDASQSTPQEEVVDPTMPQFRPNDGGSAASPAPPKKEAVVEEVPSQIRLEYFALLNDQEAEIDRRGGPARLSFDEIEAIVLEDPRGRELREMILSWLGWASF